MLKKVNKPRLLVATNNRGKALEIKNLLKKLDIEVLILEDLIKLWQTEQLAGLPIASNPSVIGQRKACLAVNMEETSNSFLGNAILKARGARDYTGLLTLADDSGLEVDCLKGAPGVFSARYAGKHGDDKANNELLLANMRDVPKQDRKARFVAAMVLATASGEEYHTEGRCEGSIGYCEQGEYGFGYDSIFIPIGQEKTLAQMSIEEKNKISHRAIALKGIIPIINNLLK